MIVPAEVVRRFNRTEPYVRQVGERVEDAVLAFCKRNNYAYIGRLKSLESVAEKIESGRFQQWSELDDLFACSIVVPTLSHEADVVRFLQSNYEEVVIRGRGSAHKSPDVFRFEATRFIGRIRTIGGTEVDPALAETAFEVQIRSAFEHAWSATTHALVYKSGTVDWKRLRLAAQLKASVEQLDNLILSFERAADTIVQADWYETEAKAEIVASFRGLSDAGLIPSDSAPNDWSRFADNVFASLRSSRSWPRGFRDRKAFVEEAIATVGERIHSFDPSAFPRSISLFQLVFGVLWEEGKIHAPLQRCHPPITRELESLFPSVKDCTTRFDFQT